MAKLYIREYNKVSQQHVNSVPVGVEPGYDQAPVSIGAGSVQSSAFQTDTKLVRLNTDVACSFVVGDNPAATTGNARLGAGATEYFGIQGNQKLAVIANT